MHLAVLGTRRHPHGAAIDRLLESPPRRAADRPNLPELDSVPPPTACYLRRALGAGQPLIRVARLSQTGVLRTHVGSARWLRFSAEQVVTPLSTGFIWDARVSVLPFVHVRVRDAYIEGRGSGEVRLLSAIPIAGDRGGLAMNSGSLHRYLAEAVWYPTALLPDPQLQWTPIDARKALATLTDRGTTVSLEFSFDDAGDVARIYSPGRWGKFEGGYRQVAWEGHFRDYREQDGMRVPSEGEVGWYDHGEWQSVFKGRLTEARYERAPRGAQQDRE